MKCFIYDVQDSKEGGGFGKGSHEGELEKNFWSPEDSMMKSINNKC